MKATITLCLWMLCMTLYGFPHSKEKGITHGKTYITSNFNAYKNYSSLVLIKDNKVLDSVLVMRDFYGGKSPKKINDSTWDYYYINRCGSGCSFTNYARLYVIKDKIYVALHILHLETYHRPFAKNRDTVVMYKFISNRERNYIEMTKNKRKKIQFNLKFDSVNKIFYNKLFIINGKKHIVLEYNSREYVYFGNRVWKSYNATNGMLFEM